MKRILPLLMVLCCLYVGVMHLHAQQSPQAVQLNNLTVNFSNMSPHIGQDLWLAVIDAETKTEVRRVHRVAELTFVMEIPEVLEDGRSYHVDFFADLNENGYYDPPGTDHAWRLQIEESDGDESLDFGHQIAFTDIEWKHRLRLSLSGMSGNDGQRLVFYVRDKGTGSYLDTVTVQSLAEEEFSMDSYVIEPQGNYLLDFYADLNGNGSYDPPPVDQAWRLESGPTVGDKEIEFSHNQDFTDIFETTGLARSEESREVLVYPNPADSYLSISMDSPPGTPVVISVFNPAGTLLSREKVSWPGSIILEIGFLPAGVYFLQLEDDSHRSFSRFIKQ